MAAAETKDISTLDQMIGADAIISNLKSVKTIHENPFPVNAFPATIQRIVNELKDCQRFPEDYTGTAFLFASATAIGLTHGAQAMNGWVQYPNIFIANVGRSNTNKTSPIITALKPIRANDQKALATYELELKIFKENSALTKKEREDRGLPEPVKPFWKKSICSDHTPESLIEAHKYNVRGVSIHVDELIGMIRNIDRYNKGNAQQLYLEAFSNSPITVDRKSGEPAYIATPCISIIGTIQPSVLPELARDNRMTDGFLFRFLFAYPDSVKKEYWSDNEIDSSILRQWDEIINKLLSLELHTDENGNPVPKILQFNPDAKRLLKQWQRENTDLCNDTETEALAGFYGKYEPYVIRFSLILQLLRCACGEADRNAIDTESVRGAIELIKYFSHTARKICSELTNVNPLDRLTTDKRKLYEALPETFTTQEGMSICTGLGMAERTFKRFVTDKDFFEHLKRGEYGKIA